MTAPMDAAEVAKRLTKTQRVAIKKCWADGNQIIVGGIDDSGIATRVINSLRMKELLAWVACADIHATEWKLNPFGLAVRQIIEQEAANGRG